MATRVHACHGLPRLVILAGFGSEALGILAPQHLLRSLNEHHQNDEGKDRWATRGRESRHRGRSVVVAGCRRAVPHPAERAGIGRRGFRTLRDPRKTCDREGRGGQAWPRTFRPCTVERNAPRQARDRTPKPRRSAVGNPSPDRHEYCAIGSLLKRTVCTRKESEVCEDCE